MLLILTSSMTVLWGDCMKDSIRNRIGAFAAGLLLLFFLISFAVSNAVIRRIRSQYLESSASAVLDFAEMTINADKAKEYFATRIRTAEYDTVLQKLLTYQIRNQKSIQRISLINFNNSAGIYIFDTGGEGLGTRLEYDDHTAPIKAELLNGRNTLTFRDNSVLIIYRPIRTVDDMLCGYLVAEVTQPLDSSYTMSFFLIYGGLLVLAAVVVAVHLLYLDHILFRPIRRLTDIVVYLAGDDNADSGKDASAMLNTKRRDEIGKLSMALQKIFFDMNTDAEHLSQALYDANHDGMTQHLNKRCYHSMEETFRECSPICAIYFDVNNLKLMNDTLGHESGDYVIKQAADYIREMLHDGDYCFRMGGDEFLVVMTACSFRTADRLMDRLEADAPHILSREEDSIKCALSFGFAYSAGDRTYEEVLTEAEENMYLKKTELKELLNMPER